MASQFQGFDPLFGSVGIDVGAAIAAGAIADGEGAGDFDPLFGSVGIDVGAAIAACAIADGEGAGDFDPLFGSDVIDVGAAIAAGAIADGEGAGDSASPMAVSPPFAPPPAISPPPAAAAAAADAPAPPTVANDALASNSDAVHAAILAAIQARVVANDALASNSDAVHAAILAAIQARVVANDALASNSDAVHAAVFAAIQARVDQMNVRSVFNAVDSNTCGRVSADELAAALRTWQVEVDEGTAEEFIKSINARYGSRRKVLPYDHFCQTFGRRSVVTHPADQPVEVVSKLLEVASKLLDQPVDVGWLQAACRNGDEAIVRMLLEHKADVDAVDDRGFTPLALVCFEGHEAVAQLLVERGAVDNWAADDLELAPKLRAKLLHRRFCTLASLYHACAAGHGVIARALLEAGAPVNGHKSEAGAPVNGHKFNRKESISVEQLRDLIVAGFNDGDQPLLRWTTATNRYSGVLTPMGAACHHGYLEIVKLLSVFGASRHVGGDDSDYDRLEEESSAEEVADEAGHATIVEWLTSTRGYTPLHHLDLISTERARSLLRGDASIRVHAGDELGLTPLDIATTMAANGEAPSGSAAELVLRAAQPWSHETHALFPAAARALAVELTLIGHLLAARALERQRRCALFVSYEDWPPDRPYFVSYAAPAIVGPTHERRRRGARNPGTSTNERAITAGVRREVEVRPLDAAAGAGFLDAWEVVIAKVLEASTKSANGARDPCTPVHRGGDGPTRCDDCGERIPPLYRHPGRVLCERCNPSPFESEELGADRATALAAVQRLGRALEHVAFFLRADREIVLAAVQQDARALRCASEALRADRDIVRAAVRKDGNALEFAAVALRAERAMVLAAVQEEEYRCRYVSNDLSCQLDHRRTFRDRNNALQFAAEALKADREIVRSAVQHFGLALQFASDELRADRELVLLAMKDSATAFEFASDELRGDREIVLLALAENGQMLRHASDELRADRELVLLAMKDSATAFEFASDELRGDREIVLLALAENGQMLRHASDELQANHEIVTVAMQNDPSSFSYAADELKADRDFVLAAVQKSAWNLEHASDVFTADREIVLAAVQQDCNLLHYAADALRADREIVRVAMQEYGPFLEHAAEALRADREFVLEAVQLSGPALEFASEELRADRDVVMAAVKQDGSALEHAAADLRADRDVVLAAMKQCPSWFTIRHASAELQDEFSHLTLAYETAED